MASQAKAQVTSWTGDWCLRWGQACGTEPSPVGSDAVSTSGRIELNRLVLGGLPTTPGEDHLRGPL